MTTVSPLAMVIGVPRSGTTLLRFLLGGHPDVAAPAETPWIAGAYGPPASVRHLIEFLAEHARGTQNLGDTVSNEEVFEAARLFVGRVLAGHLAAMRARHIILKTPQDILQLPFLHRLFPATRFVHIIRDGRDVALSTRSVRHWPTLHGFGPNDIPNALDRWSDWVRRPRGATELDPTIELLEVHYESLVADPEATLRQVSAFIGLEYDPAMLAYAQSVGSLPEQEIGSQDVSARTAVTATRALQWPRMLTPLQIAQADIEHGELLAALGYEFGKEARPYRRDQLLAAHLAVMARPLSDRWKDITQGPSGRGRHAARRLLRPGAHNHT